MVNLYKHMHNIFFGLLMLIDTHQAYSKLRQNSPKIIGPGGFPDTGEGTGNMSQAG